MIAYQEAAQCCDLDPSHSRKGNYDAGRGGSAQSAEMAVVSAFGT